MIGWIPLLLVCQAFTFRDPSMKTVQTVITSLIHQDFEGTGYDNSETWTEAGTCTIDEDQTTIHIDGSQSLDLNTTANACSTFASFSAQSGTTYAGFKIRHASGAGVGTIICTLRAGTTVRATLTIRTGPVLAVLASGGTANLSTVNMPQDTTTDIWIWFEYVNGSGANAIARAGWSTDGTKPTFTAGGNQSCISSDGTGTDNLTRIYLGHDSSITERIIWDRVRVSTVALGNSFP